MATNADESPASRKVDDLPDTSSTSGSDGENSSDEAAAQKIEWLATTRERRATAGNRMKAMLANEEPAAEDSDLELLFAEDEDDAGFTDVGNDASDVQMDSSSDDEDQEQGGDELEGEKELERQAREKKNAQRKRKAQDAIPAKFRKKVRIEQPAADSASVSSAAPQQHKPRPKKKSERMSWLPTAAEMPTRASERRTTKMSKEQLHEKMVKDEIRRKKQIEAMEKKAKRLEALKKPPMTQAERLAEAALVEKRNSKSLNRWEVAEKQREEERLRKIAALNSRKLEGPVVTVWSGIQELEEGQLKHVGKMVSIEEKAPRKKRQPAAATLAAQELANAKAAEASKPPSPTTATADLESKPAADLIPPVAEVKPEAPETPTLDKPIPPPPLPSKSPKPSEPPQQPQPSEPSQAPQAPLAPQPPQPPQPLQTSQPPPAQETAPKPPEKQPNDVPNQGLMAPPPAPPSLSDPKQAPSMVLAAPVLAPPQMLGGQMPMMGFPAPNGKSNVLALPNTSHTPTPSATPSPPAATPPVGPKQTTGTPTATSTTISKPRTTPSKLSTTTSLQPTQGKAQSNGPDTPQQQTPNEPPREGKVTRSCIILQNFDEDAIKDKQVQTLILFGRKMNKLARPAHAALCVITNHPAKYRDPKTNLPYYNTYAFREIQRALRGDYKFSPLHGTYMGSGKYAAKGVPERFLDPTKSRSTPKTKPPEPPVEGAVKQEEGGGEPKAVEEKQDTSLPVVESRLEPTLTPVPAEIPAPAPPSTFVPQPAQTHTPDQISPAQVPGNVQSPASAQTGAQGPVYGAVFAPIHPPPPAPGQAQAHPHIQTSFVPPPALPGSAEEAIASVRNSRVSTPPVNTTGQAGV